MIKRIDAELLLKLAKDIGIEVPVTGSLDDFIMNTSRLILKEQFPKTRIKPNMQGFSISFPANLNPNVAELYRFSIEEGLPFSSNFGKYEIEVMQVCCNISSFENFRHYMANNPPEYSSRGLLIKVRFLTPNFYSRYLVYNVICEIIELMSYIDSMIERLPLFREERAIQEPLIEERNRIALEERNRLLRQKEEEDARRQQILMHGLSGLPSEMARKFNQALKDVMAQQSQVTS